MYEAADAVTALDGARGVQKLCQSPRVQFIGSIRENSVSPAIRG
jgi:hypothetical protein